VTVADVERALAYALAHPFADLPRAAGICLRQYREEFFAAVAHEQIAAADRAAQPAGSLLGMRTAVFISPTFVKEMMT